MRFRSRFTSRFEPTRFLSRFDDGRTGAYRHSQGRTIFVPDYTISASFTADASVTAALVPPGPDPAIAVAHDTTPFVSAYPWSAGGFGTKFSDPATLPTGGGYGVAFSSAGDAIAVAHSTTPFVSAYPWSGSGFGTKFSDPATLPANTGLGVAFLG